MTINIGMKFDEYSRISLNVSSDISYRMRRSYDTWCTHVCVLYNISSKCICLLDIHHPKFGKEKGEYFRGITWQHFESSISCLKWYCYDNYHANYIIYFVQVRHNHIIKLAFWKTSPMHNPQNMKWYLQFSYVWAFVWTRACIQFHNRIRKMSSTWTHRHELITKGIKLNIWTP